MYTIRVTSDMCEKAKRKADEMMKNGMYSRMGYDNEQRWKKAFQGAIGEIAFASLMDSNGIEYALGEYHRELRSDDCDFIVNGKRLDVKIVITDKTPRGSWTYGYPVEQHPADKDYIIVGLLASDHSQVSFYGIIAGRDIAAAPIKNSNTFGGFSYKTDNYEFRYDDMDTDIFRYL